MTWDLATLQYHRWAGRAGWEADSDYTVDWRGRLEIRACMPRRGPTVWPVKYSLASRDIRVNRSNVPVAGGCTWAEPVKDFTDNVIYNGSDRRIQPPAHVP
jgi:hypothetical protein